MNLLATRNWTTVFRSKKPTENRLTVVMKLTDGVSLSELLSTLLIDAVITAARFTPSEVKETYFRIQNAQNILIADMYRPSALKKLLQTTQILIQNDT